MEAAIRAYKDYLVDRISESTSSMTTSNDDVDDGVFSEGMHHMHMFQFTMQSLNSSQLGKSTILTDASLLATYISMPTKCYLTISEIITLTLPRFLLQLMCQCKLFPPMALNGQSLLSRRCPLLLIWLTPRIAPSRYSNCWKSLLLGLAQMKRVKYTRYYLKVYCFVPNLESILPSSSEFVP